MGMWGDWSGAGLGATELTPSPRTLGRRVGRMRGCGRFLGDSHAAIPWL